MWLARISAPAAAVAVSGGFFGVAFFPGLRWLLYFGILFILVVFFFPRGVLGTVRETIARPRRRLPSGLSGDPA